MRRKPNRSSAPRRMGAFATLAQQHADLSERIARCSVLAEDVDAGGVEPAQLLREVVALRTALDAHNRYEEQLLTPLLLDASDAHQVAGVDADAVAAGVAQSVDAHTEEHRAMRRDLDGETTGELRRVLASLRAHLASEESFLRRRRRKRAGPPDRS